MRARCIFSVSLNESTLQGSSGAPPGSSAEPEDGRARMRLLQSLAGRTTAVFRSVLDDLVSTAFPSDCRVCNRPLLRSTILPICDNCRTSVPPQTLAMCRICGEALDIDMESARFASQFMDEGLLCDGLPQSSAEVRARRCVRCLPERTARDDSPAQVRADERCRQTAWRNARQVHSDARSRDCWPRVPRN